MSQWIGRVDGVDLYEEDKPLFQMFPGILFGFAPQNFKAIKERWDCPHCRAMGEKLKVLVIEKIGNGFWHKAPLIGNVLNRKLNNERETLLAEIKSVEERDEKHWLRDEDREVSQEFMTAYVGLEIPE